MANGRKILEDRIAPNVLTPWRLEWFRDPEGRFSLESVLMISLVYRVSDSTALKSKVRAGVEIRKQFETFCR